jgi:starch phosphorylase
VRTIHRYSVRPSLPARLAGLHELAFNLRWAWDHDTIELFIRLDPDLWEQSRHNPARLLAEVAQERLDRAAADEGFLANLERVYGSLRSYMDEPTWFKRRYPESDDMSIAYFSMEFGLAECLPIYSGGLGVLAGDHLKSASDLGLPLVAVGLMYQKGYFAQYLNPDGWQLEASQTNDFAMLPATRVEQDDGAPVRVRVDLAGKDVLVGVWRVQVGRIPLFLLDTNLPENEQADQDVTEELYSGGPETRIRQEIVLGIGGVRALHAMGYRPAVCHMNEGHSAFLSLERLRRFMAENDLDYHSARQVVGAGTIFTTHTPVPAGFDLFSEELMKKYFSAYIGDLHLDWDTFMNKGRSRPGDEEEPFNVAVLAVRHAPRRNAVSRLHRRVTARMLRVAWPELPENEIPIDSVTNGVHTSGWIAPEIAGLLDRYAGPRWREDVADPTVWARVSVIPDEELWRTHVRQRERLVAYARSRFRAQLERRNASPAEVLAAGEVLSSDALTIGFARRFATYKRATLILHEVDRLKALLLNEQRPVQIIFGGKAHPRDDAGKALIREIVHFAAHEGVQHRLIFLEDYDIEKARMLVRGCDVWLNTPRRPLEASGTSGMKVLANGGLNLSVLDGWWVEGYRQEAGWAIGRGEEYEDLEYQDRVEAQALYSILEQEVIPLFYKRGADGLPRDWISMMKNSMRYLTPAFSTTRMVREYLEKFYLPAAHQYARVSADGFARAREVAVWKKRVRDLWNEVRVVSVEQTGGSEVQVGSELPIRVQVSLGGLSRDDIQVMVYRGILRPDDQVSGGRIMPLSFVGETDGQHVYEGAVPCPTSGSYGYAVGVFPHQEDVLIPNELNLVTWE